MLLLPETQRRRLVAHCRAESPREGCGLLLGRREAGRLLIVEALPARNAEPRRPASRFELHPADLVRGESRAREAGCELLGVWHSHPQGEPRPSWRDEAAAETGWLQLIVGLGGDRGPELRAWRPRDGRLVEEALEVVGE